MTVLEEKYESKQWQPGLKEKIFAENAVCPDWNTIYNVIASDIINHNI